MKVMPKFVISFLLIFSVIAAAPAVQTIPLSKGKYQEPRTGTIIPEEFCYTPIQIQFENLATVESISLFEKFEYKAGTSVDSPSARFDKLIFTYRFKDDADIEDGQIFSVYIKREGWSGEYRPGVDCPLFRIEYIECPVAVVSAENEFSDKYQRDVPRITVSYNGLISKFDATNRTLDQLINGTPGPTGELLPGTLVFPVNELVGEQVLLLASGPGNAVGDMLDISINVYGVDIALSAVEQLPPNSIGIDNNIIEVDTDLKDSGRLREGDVSSCSGLPFQDDFLFDRVVESQGPIGIGSFTEYVLRRTWDNIVAHLSPDGEVGIAPLTGLGRTRLLAVLGNEWVIEDVPNTFSGVIVKRKPSCYSLDALQQLSDGELQALLEDIGASPVEIADIIANKTLFTDLDTFLALNPATFTTANTGGYGGAYSRYVAGLPEGSFDPSEMQFIVTPPLGEQDGPASPNYFQPTALFRLLQLMCIDFVSDGWVSNTTGGFTVADANYCDRLLGLSDGAEVISSPSLQQYLDGRGLVNEELYPNRPASDFVPSNQYTRREMDNSFWVSDCNLNFTYWDSDLRDRYQMIIDANGLARHNDTNELFDGQDPNNPDEPLISNYVMDMNGRIYVYPFKISSATDFVKHSQALAGGPVAAAGDIFINDGKIEMVDLASGHYLPPPEYIDNIRNRLIELGADLTDTSFVPGF